MFKRWLEHPDQPDLFGQRLTMFDPRDLDRLRTLALGFTAIELGSGGASDLLEASAIRRPLP